MGDDKMNPEGETNIQIEGNIPENNKDILTGDTVIETETSGQEIPQDIIEKEALNFVIEKQEKIDQKTIEIEEKNKELLNLDKLKGLLKDELDVLKFKAYELANNVKKNMSWSHIGKIAATSSLVVLFAACSSVKHDVAMAVPQEMTKEAEIEKTQTQEASVPTPTSEATLSPEEIREKRLNEIAEVVKENDNSFTIEQLNAYLQKYGTGWEGGIEAMMEYYKGILAPFQYCFIEKSYKDSGVFIAFSPYKHSVERTMSDNNSFPTPEVVNEEMLGKVTKSIYEDLHLNPDGTAGWIQEPGKYTVIFYITTQYDENGKPYDAFFTDRADLFFEDAEGNIKNVSREDAINKNLSDEELALFTDDVLDGIKERWTMFITNEDGSLEKRSDFKEIDDLLHPATSSDTVAQEIN